MDIMFEYKIETYLNAGLYKLIPCMGSAIFIKNTGNQDFLIHETIHFAFKLKRFLILIHLEISAHADGGPPRSQVCTR